MRSRGGLKWELDSRGLTISYQSARPATTPSHSR
jgi:hypothetical protein